MFIRFVQETAPSCCWRLPRVSYTVGAVVDLISYRGALIRRISLIVAFGLVLVACTGGGAPDRAETIAVEACVESANPYESLCGRALEGPTGLVLVVGDTVVDIDADTRQRIEGLPDGSGFVPPASQPIWAQRVGSDAVVGVADSSGRLEVFTVRPGSLRAIPVGFGSPIPGLGGVWLREKISADECRLSKVTLGGDILSASTSVGCDVSLIEETSVGLVGVREVEGVFSGVILDSENPSTTLFEIGSIRGIFGSRVLHQAGGGSDFVVFDTLTGEEITIDLPVRFGQPSYGRLSPDGRYLAIPFKSPLQVFDIWVLDTETLQWARVPSMPVASGVKATSLAWVPDGRLIILLTLEPAGHQLATWTPGDSELQVRQLDYELEASVAVWCTTNECE
ncbi:hypothetical protein MNBD_ACTINO02-647 [hydrothermal vent metagenome]|uniref:Uncharacterized protein n=1 Tax=hydrothermal vent metagenome TaxID=652676 RepID=A0A3B0RUC4_9ZZZZ